MAENYVQIKIKASDTAKPDLTDLKLKLDELGHKVETAKVEVDDEDASLKLLRMNAKLAELDRKVSNPKIKVDGAARAEAEILYIEHEMDKLNRKADDAGPTGLLGKILSGVGGAGGGVPGSLGPVPLPAVAALIPVVGAVATELVGLASGFAAAGAGAGAFYLLAHPTISNLTQDYTKLQSAQQAYQLAQNKAAIDPTKANLKAEQNALVSLQAVRRGMTADEAGAAGGIARLSGEYHKLTAAFAPDVFKVFNSGLKVAGDLLPAVLPFARSFATALDGLLQHVDKFAKSKGFQDWLKQFGSLVGPAVTAIGNGLGKVVPALGKLLTLMSKKDVVNAINIAFSVLAGTITIITAGISRFMKNYDSMSSTVRRDSHDIAVSFDSVRHFAATMGHDVAVVFDAIRHAVAVWVTNMARDVGQVVSFFLGLPKRILGAVGNLGSLLWNAGRAVVTGFLNGIGSLIGSIGTAAWNMVQSLGSTVLHFLGIGSPSKVAHWWGQMVAQGLADGISHNAHLPAGAAARMAAGVSGGLSGAVGGAGGGAVAGAGVLTIRLQGGGGGLDQLFMGWLKNAVRAGGGDPRMFNRKVAFQ